MEYIRKHKKRLLLIFDLLLVPGLLLCKSISAWMLAGDGECPWLLLGGKCITCGGTHFVNALTGGRIAEAFGHNPFLFLLTVFFAVSWVLLHLHWLWEKPVAKRALQGMYSYRVLLVWIFGMVAFFFLRNLELFAKVAAIIFQ